MSKYSDFILWEPSPERPAKTYTFTEDFSFRTPYIPQWLVNEILISCQRHSPKPHPPTSRLLSYIILEIKDRYPPPARCPSINELLFYELERYVQELYELHRDTLRTGPDHPSLF